MRQRDVVMHISMLNVQHHFGFESQKVWLKKKQDKPLPAIVITTTR